VVISVTDVCDEFVSCFSRHTVEVELIELRDGSRHCGSCEGERDLCGSEFCFVSKDRSVEV
jgi:hypothetical protein